MATNVNECFKRAAEMSYEYVEYAIWIGCHTKPDQPNQTDSNAALLLHLIIHQLGSLHEWSSVWNGP